MINKVNKSIIIFAIFAFGFFISNLLRSITATLTPVLTNEFNLTAGNLGLLAGGYFLGFSLMQIPAGLLLDKYGPKKVVAYLLLIALVATISFAFAKNFTSLLISRFFIGVGVSACLMGPLTGYRLWFKEKYQQIRDQKIRERVEALGVEIQDGDSRETLLEKEKQYTLDRQKI